MDRDEIDTQAREIWKKLSGELSACIILGARRIHISWACRMLIHVGDVTGERAVVTSALWVAALAGGHVWELAAN